MLLLYDICNVRNMPKYWNRNVLNLQRSPDSRDINYISIRSYY